MIKWESPKVRKVARRGKIHVSSLLSIRNYENLGHGKGHDHTDDRQQVAPIERVMHALTIRVVTGILRTLEELRKKSEDRVERLIAFDDDQLSSDSLHQNVQSPFVPTQGLKVPMGSQLLPCDVFSGGRVSIVIGMR